MMKVCTTLTAMLTGRRRTWLVVAEEAVATRRACVWRDVVGRWDVVVVVAAAALVLVALWTVTIETEVVLAAWEAAVAVAVAETDGLEALLVACGVWAAVVAVAGATYVVTRRTAVEAREAVSAVLARAVVGV